MKRLSCLLLFVAACGPRTTPREIGLLRASLGVTAGELASSAGLDRLQAIAADLKSTDPAIQKLGMVECVLLQERAKTLGREVSAELPLVMRNRDRNRNADQVDRLSSELQGAVHCQQTAPFDPVKLAKLLGGDAATITGLLQPGA